MVVRTGQPPYTPVPVSGLTVWEQLEGFYPLGYANGETVRLSDSILANFPAQIAAAEAAAEAAADSATAADGSADAAAGSAIAADASADAAADSAAAAAASAGKIPTSSTDNNAVRFDGTNGTLQGSPVTFGDDGDITTVSDETGTAAGPVLVLDRANPAPVTGSFGGVLFSARDSSDSAVTFASIVAAGTDVTAGSTDGRLNFNLVAGGALGVRFTLDATYAAFTVPLLDTTAFSDDADVTKMGRFELSGVTSGFTRIITWPDYNLNLGLLIYGGGSQTLDAGQQTQAQTNMGGTTIGRALFTADDLTEAYTTLGYSAVIQDFVAAADADAALSSLLLSNQGIALVQAPDYAAMRALLAVVGVSGSPTDNVVPRFDGTGGDMQPSALTIDDNGNADLVGNTLRVLSTSDDATAGPVLSLSRQSPTPAADDIIGVVYMRGMDSSAAEKVYGGVEARIVSPTAGTESGFTKILARDAGTLAAPAIFYGNRIEFNRPLVDTAEYADAGDLTRKWRWDGGALPAGATTVVGVPVWERFLVYAPVGGEPAIDILGLDIAAMVRIKGISKPATDNVRMFNQTSTNGGASFDGGATDYIYSFRYAQAGSALSIGNGFTTSVNMNPGNQIGNASAEWSDFSIEWTNFNKPQNAFFDCRSAWLDQNSNFQDNVYNRGLRNSPVARNAMRLAYSSGNFGAGGLIIVEIVRG